MPWVWKEPELFMTAEETGHTDIYYTYKGECTQQYYYQIKSSISYSDYAAFDIRELVAAAGYRIPDGSPETERQRHKESLRTVQHALGGRTLPEYLHLKDLWSVGEVV